jgi:hypothetical protein
MCIGALTLTSCINSSMSELERAMQPLVQLNFCVRVPGTGYLTVLRREVLGENFTS